MMKIGGIQRCSTIDYPAHISCVLFTRGCDLNCFYCHNRALLHEGENLPLEEVFAFLSKRQGKLDGVVISGGEPTLQSGLTDFLLEIKRMGFLIKLDTNGQRPAVVEELLAKNIIDYVAVDVKASATDYEWVCGAKEGFALALQTLALLDRTGIAYEARTTLYAGLGVVSLVQLMQNLPILPCYRLNVFRMPEVFRPEDALLLRRHAISFQELDTMKEELQKLQPNIVW